MSTPLSLTSPLIRCALVMSGTLVGLYAGDAPATPPAPAVTTAPPLVAPPAPAQHGRAGDITIRIITIDANGELSDASHKILDDLMEDGWRTTGMTLVSATPPITLAVMLSLPPRRAPMPFRPPGMPGQPMQPGMPQPMPQSATPAPAPAPAPAFAPAPPPAGK